MKLEEWIKKEKAIFNGRYDCYEAEIYFRIIEHLMKAVEFYADSNNTVRECMSEFHQLCANVELSKIAKEAIEACEKEIS